MPVTASNYQFSPSAISVKHGCTVAVTDSSGYHTFSGGGFETGQMSPGQTVILTIALSPGTYRFRCMNHSQMVGTMRVT